MCTRMPLLLAQLILVFMSSMAMSRTVQSSGLQSSDLYRLRAVGEVKFSHDYKYIAYSVEGAGTRLDMWGVSLADHKTAPILDTLSWCASA